MANYNAPWNKGLVGVQTHSVDTKRKMSVSHTGTKKPVEVCLKIRASNIGKHNKGIQRPQVQGELHYHWNPNKSAFRNYRRLVQRQTEAIYQKHLYILNPENHQRTLCGVKGGYQLDHKMSVKEGFEKNLSVHEIAHINNLQMLPWQENRKKGV